MAKANVALTAFNRGVVSRYALARVDIERMKLSAEEQVNFLPRTLGPMMLRPGLAYKGSTKGDAQAEFIPFVYSSTEKAAVELTDGYLRIWIDDEPIERLSVTTTISDGDFSGSAAWTLTNTGGATSSISGGVLTMAAPTIGGLAKATNAITVAGGEINTEHGIRIVVTRGPVRFRIGTTSGAQDVVRTITLDTGTHSLAVTPTAATIYAQFETDARIECKVDSITVEAAGVVELPTPWAVTDLSSIRHAQSGDVIFVACSGKQQRRIERRGARSWGVALYRSNDGPFTAAATVDGVSFTPGATYGNTTITASRDFFLSTHVGALFRLFQTSQYVTADLAALDAVSESIRVTGVGSARKIEYRVSGTFTGTVELQRSFDGEDSGFLLVSGKSYTAATSGELDFTDDYDNSVAWYRFKVTAYTSGTFEVTLRFPSGGGAGIVRVTGFTSATEVDVEVLSTLKALTATKDWREGEWSDAKGWPTAVELFDGRLWWFGKDKQWGSASDAFSTFDVDDTTDAGPISRSIGQGPIETIHWALGLQRLLLGTATSEVSIRSSSFDEPLTPTNFTQKPCSTQGSATVPAVRMDSRGLFVQKSKRRLFQLAFDFETADYKPTDLTQLAPEIATANIRRLAVQRQPDTRIHAVLEDGTVAVLVYEPEEEVLAWWTVETDGDVETVFVLPGEIEDQVYYVVNRTINGSAKRFVERFAREDEARGGTGSRIADSHITYSGAGVTTITGLSHLEGETVVVWGNGKDLGTKTVSGGEITGLSEEVTTACVGLSYEARYKSSKLAYAAQMGTALTQKKRIDHLGLVLADTHKAGLQYGQDDYDNLDDLPLIEDGVETGSDEVWEDFDKPSVELNGTWNTDARLCLKATAPRPVTVMAAVISLATHDK